MRDRPFLKIALLVTILAGIILFYVLGGDEYLTLPFIKSKLDDLQLAAKNNFWQVTAVFCAINIVLGAFSIPGSIVLTLLAGTLYGVTLGTFLVLLTGSIAASIAFLMARYLFRDFATRKLGKHFKEMDQKVKTEGRLYLLILRMIPASPFVVINNVMGLTSMKLWPFFYMTFLGMLPGTVIYVYAGLKISEIDDVGEIMSLPVILSLLAIGLFPVITKKIVNVYRKRHHLGASL